MTIPYDADPSHEGYLRRRPKRYPGYQRASRYLKMRDGVRIAVDVCLPRGLGNQQVPTLLRQTRYFRRFDVHPLLRRLLGENTLDPMNAPMRSLFTSRGYAWVDVDVRGSGASFGERPCPWWLDGEVADGSEIAEWIVRQPWSNGRIGSTGVSYEGTTAEFLAISGHAAVRAVAPRFSLFDVYADVAFPGGLHSSYFTQAWGAANAALDRNAPGEMVALIYMLQAHGMLDPRLARRVDRPLARAALSRLIGWALGGVAPTDDDPEALAFALASHAQNYNVHTGAVQTSFRDDSPSNAAISGKTSDYFSPHSYAERLRDVAVLSYGGWFDGGYANAACKRHRTLTALGADSRLLLGPWIHGGQLVLDPEAPRHQAGFHHAAELLRFFDQYLWPELAPEAELARVRYFSMGEGRWREATSFPPAGVKVRELHFGPDRKLTATPGSAGSDGFEPDTEVGAGQRSRWRTLLCPFLQADGKGRSPDGYLVYQSEPLEADLRVAGNPVLVLGLSSNAPDGAIVVYLEDVTPEGEPRLLTEGELRTLHGTRLIEADGMARAVASFLRRDANQLAPGLRAVHVIELLPLAWRFRRGHRLRLLLGAADVDHFTTPLGPSRIEWRIELAKSRLLLPALPG